MIAILNLSEKVVGKVYTTLTIVNRADQVLVENEFWSEEQIRSITLKQVLLDTGATTLLEMLGLEPDLQNQALRVLPTDSVDTYLTIL